MGPLSGVVILKILYRFGDEDLVIWTATSASMNRSTASEILEWIINPLCATAFIDILFENIKISLQKEEMFKDLLWNMVFSQRCNCRWLGTSACTALARKVWHFRGQLTLEKDATTQTTWLPNRSKGLTQTLKYWYYIVVCKRDSQPVRLPMEAEIKMSVTLETTFVTEFSWLKLYNFRLKFPLFWFVRVQLRVSQYWVR